MTSSTKVNIVEHVARAFEYSLIKGHAGDGYVQPEGIDPFTLVVDCNVDPKAVARATIRATLEYARDRLTHEMVNAMAAAPNRVEAYRAMIAALLSEIDQDGGKG